VPYTVGQFALGLEGLALLRAGPLASDEALASRVTELTALAGTLDDPSRATEAVGTRMDVLSGYARWASVYDQPNPLVMVEEPAARQAFATWPQRSRVLDVACGTGRHTSYLHELGHDVIGIDVSPEMVRVAREKLPEVRFLEGPMDPLPFDDGEFDAAVCALALSHIADIAAPIAEMARVVRPGGHLVVTDFHPFMVLLGGQGAFRTADGAAHFVPSYVHLPGQMLEVLASTGLTPLACAEPTWTLKAAELAFPGMSARFYEEAIAGLPLAIVWQLAPT
jgi:ubiquinone/menaquinone biosynthesis C-methylase UbiE